MSIEERVFAATESEQSVTTPIRETAFQAPALKGAEGKLLFDPLASRLPIEGDLAPESPTVVKSNVGYEDDQDTSARLELAAFAPMVEPAATADATRAACAPGMWATSLPFSPELLSDSDFMATEQPCATLSAPGEVLEQRHGSAARPQLTMEASGMRELVVLIENLTGDEFELVGAESMDGSGSLPESFQRSARLSWRCVGPCAVAVEYVTIGSLPRRVRIAASLPKPLVGTSQISFVDKVSPPSFSADVIIFARGGWNLPSTKRPSSHRELQSMSERLSAALNTAPCLETALTQGQGSDWLVILDEPTFLMIRVRLLPTWEAEATNPEWSKLGSTSASLSPTGPYSISATASSPSRDISPSPRTKAAQAEVQRLRIHCENIRLHNLTLEAQSRVSSQFPLDPGRFAVMPERVRVDLALAVIGVLFARRFDALDRLGGGAASTLLGTVLSVHADRFFRTLIPTLGFTDPRVETRLASLVAQYLSHPDVEPPEVDKLGLELRHFFAEMATFSGLEFAEIDNPASPMAFPQGWLAIRELVAAGLSGMGGSFDARSRAALLELALHLGVPQRLVEHWEAELGESLFEAMQTTKILKQHRDSGKHIRQGQVALAAAGGGVLLAITGGWAAPALAGLTSATVSTCSALGLVNAASLIASASTFFTSFGTSGAAVVFGATGAGLTGWKMSRRWRCLKEFKFEPLFQTQLRAEYAVELRDSETVRFLDAALAASGGVLPESISLPTTPTVDSSSSKSQGTSFDKADEVVFVPQGSRVCSRETAKSNGNVVVRYCFWNQRSPVDSAVHLVVFVPGWSGSDGDLAAPWQESAKLFFPNSGHFALHWETDALRELSNVFASMVTQQVTSSATSFWLKSVALAGSTAAAASLSWPIWIISSMAALDNQWLVCAERARLAGTCLAHAIADKRVVGKRPVTLIGHSMGARLIFYCLNELYQMNEFHLIDDVVLFGAPLTTRPAEWQQARAVVSGRLINCYSPSDWILAFLYRYLEWGFTVAGLSEVKSAGVENVDVSTLGVCAHDDYMRHALLILAKACAGEKRLTGRSCQFSCELAG